MRERGGRGEGEEGDDEAGDTVKVVVFDVDEGRLFMNQNW